MEVTNAGAVVRKPCYVLFDQIPSFLLKIQITFRWQLIFMVFGVQNVYLLTKEVFLVLRSWEEPQALGHCLNTWAVKQVVPLRSKLREAPSGTALLRKLCCCYS